MISGFASEFYNFSFLSEFSKYSWFYIRVLQIFLVLHQSSSMIPGFASENSNYSFFIRVLQIFLVLHQSSPIIPGFTSEFSNYFWFYIRVLQCGVPSRGRLSEPFQFFSFINKGSGGIMDGV